MENNEETFQQNIKENNKTVNENDSILNDLKNENAKLKNENAKLKKERDEANSNIINSNVKKNEKSLFDKLFGGLIV